jgi:hypothetical protein
MGSFLVDDRTLLELAAKAAGLKINARAQAERDALIDPASASLWLTDGSTAWNSLKDGNDALRLAVACGLAVIPYPIYTRPKHSVIVRRYEESQAVYRSEVKQVEVIEVYGSDPAAATRRAITRAAAAIALAQEKT